MMWRARAVASGPGVTPDLEASEEVLIWMWMFKGVVGGGERAARPRESWVAFLEESTEETRKRLGIWEARGLHLSRDVRSWVEQTWIVCAISNQENRGIVSRANKSKSGIVIPMFINGGRRLYMPHVTKYKHCKKSNLDDRKQLT